MEKSCENASRHPDQRDGWLASTRWSNSYLREAVGDAPVLVEERSSVKEKFGQLNEVAMPFAKFVDLVEAGDPLHYLTTQVRQRFCRLVLAVPSFICFFIVKDLRKDAEGRPLLTAPPVTQLLSDVPLRLPLLSGLVPSNLNLWIGGGGAPKRVPGSSRWLDTSLFSHQVPRDSFPR
jgi:hypothetical protein